MRKRVGNSSRMLNPWISPMEQNDPSLKELRSPNNGYKKEWVSIIDGTVPQSTR
jgi:hypothetical protein